MQTGSSESEEGKGACDEHVRLILGDGERSGAAVGATRIVKGWPSHLSGCWTVASLAIGVFTLGLLMVLTMSYILSGYYTGRHICPANRTHPPGALFVLMADEPLTPRRMCAIASAARLRPQEPCVVLRLWASGSFPDVAGRTTATNILRRYSNVQLLDLDEDVFFDRSPLQDVWRSQGRSQREFAARVLALWLYGGTVYSLDVISDTHTFPTETGVVVEPKSGAILAAHAPCHAFVYHLLLELSKPSNGTRSAEDVLQHGLGSYCGPRSRGCQGVNIFPPHALCTGHNIVEQGCIWRMVGPEESESFRRFCAEIVGL